MKAIAPMRISFAGGGTDVEPYCSSHGGAVLSAAIKVYATAEYPAANDKSNEIERTIISHFGNGGISVSSDVKPRSGLGGSAALFVAGIKAIRPYLEGEQLADLAFYLERYNLGIRGGKQDQYASAYGGLNYMSFGRYGVNVKRLNTPPSLERLLLLVYMGDRKSQGKDIIKDQMSRDNTDNFRVQKSIVECMKSAIESNDLKTFGLLLEMAWASKLRFSPLICNKTIRDFHNDCIHNGAIGGKLTGAGGGGYMLLMATPDKPNDLRNYLDERSVEYLNIEFDTEGARCLSKKS